MKNEENINITILFGLAQVYVSPCYSIQDHSSHPRYHHSEKVKWSNCLRETELQKGTLIISDP